MKVLPDNEFECLSKYDTNTKLLPIFFYSAYLIHRCHYCFFLCLRVGFLILVEPQSRQRAQFYTVW